MDRVRAMKELYYLDYIEGLEEKVRVMRPLKMDKKKREEKLCDEICKKCGVKRIEDLSKSDWCAISECQKLSEEFIDKFKDKVVWRRISIHQKLSESFIAKFQDKVDWSYISLYQILSEDFIDKFQNKVNWYYISKKQKLSSDFAVKYCTKLGWNYIANRSDLKITVSKK